MLSLAVTAVAQPERPIKRPENYDLDAVITQTLPIAEPPPAVSAATVRLVFHAAPLSGKGLLTQQVNDALKAIDKANGNASVVYLRAFVAGNNDMRRVPSIVAEDFTKKKWPLPAITTVQVGALPMENAQVAIEAISEERSKRVNADGLAFFTAVEAATAAEAVAKLAAAMSYAAAEPVRVTCFAQSLREAELVRSVAAQQMPKAATIAVQSTRYDLGRTTACEGAGRLRKPPVRPPTIERVDGAVLVRSPRLVFAAAQLVFGEDVPLATERVKRTLEAQGVGLGDVVAAGVYSLAPKSLSIGEQAARRAQVVEGLPSLDASAAIEVVAAGN